MGFRVGVWGVGETRGQGDKGTTLSTTGWGGKYSIPYSLFPIPHSLFPIPYSPFPIPHPHLKQSYPKLTLKNVLNSKQDMLR